MDTKTQIYDALRGMGISVEHVTHEVVHTIEDCAAPARALRAVVAKNLFLTPRNHAEYYLCLTMPDARFRTAEVSKQIGASRLSFADESAFRTYLHAEPGAASPMGLLFPESERIILLVDAELRACDRLAFHPCSPDESLAMSARDFFEVFLPTIHRNPIWITLSKGETAE